MKRSTLWIIGVSTTVITTFSLGAIFGKNHWKHPEQYSDRYHHHHHNDCDDGKPGNEKAADYNQFKTDSTKGN